MTIKEIENLSGMTRANIRFYESEGLLKPARNDNGYRNYSEEDLMILQRIRLLRTLHVSLEEIKALDQGQRSLNDALSDHISRLKREEKDLEQCRNVCEQICRDHASYQSFDAGPYLELLATPSAGTAELKEDALPKVTSPWKRHFARNIDLLLYTLAWDAFLSLVFRINIHPSVLNTGLYAFIAVSGTIAGALLMLLAEPLLLSLTGTTPGKLIFGLYVTAPDGSRLTQNEARRRTWGVIRWGLGFFIPVYGWIRRWKSYTACKKEETLEWEQESVLVLKKRSTYLSASAYLCAFVLLEAASTLAWQAAAIPPHRGSLTDAEFCENYNWLQHFYGIEGSLLDENGSWKDPEGVFILHFAELPELQFDRSGDHITGVRFVTDHENDDTVLGTNEDVMAVAAVAFICAQEDYQLLKIPPQEIYDQITENAWLYDDFSFTAAGVTVSASFDYFGYEWSENGLLIPAYGEAPSYHMEFSMEITGEADTLKTSPLQFFLLN